MENLKILMQTYENNHAIFNIYLGQLENGTAEINEEIEDAIVDTEMDFIDAVADQIETLSNGKLSKAAFKDNYKYETEKTIKLSIDLVKSL